VLTLLPSHGVLSRFEENHDSHQLSSYLIVFKIFTDAPYMP